MRGVLTTNLKQCVAYSMHPTAQHIASRTDLAIFCQTVLKDQQTNRPLVLAPIQLSWLIHLEHCWQSGLDCLILAPMGHGKSQIMAVGVPLYLLGRNTKSRIKLLSATDPLASDRVALCRQYIVEDLDYRTVFPHVRPTTGMLSRRAWRGNKFIVERDSLSPDASLEAFGVLANGTGGRCDYLILDDVATEENSQGSAAVRRKCITRYNLSWRTRLEDHGKLAAIGTLYHKEDVNNSLRDRSTTSTLIQAVAEDFGHIDFRVENADDEHPLLPWRTGGPSAIIK